MHIKRVLLKDFRRFSSIEIAGLPEKAKLVILAGPNGNGKSSLFDAFLKFIDSRTDGHSLEVGYHRKQRSGENVATAFSVEFHEGDKNVNSRKYFYFRSAYRNDPAFVMS